MKFCTRDPFSLHLTVIELHSHAIPFTTALRRKGSGGGAASPCSRVCERGDDDNFHLTSWAPAEWGCNTGSPLCIEAPVVRRHRCPTGVQKVVWCVRRRPTALHKHFTQAPNRQVDKNNPGETKRGGGRESDYKQKDIKEVGRRVLGGGVFFSCMNCAMGEMWRNDVFSLSWGIRHQFDIQWHSKTPAWPWPEKRFAFFLSLIFNLCSIQSSLGQHCVVWLKSLLEFECNMQMMCKYITTANHSFTSTKQSEVPPVKLLCFVHKT